MPLSQPAVAAADGWLQDAARTWTRASNTSFTVNGVDVTAQFPKGTRLKVTDTTTKYFVVVGATFSTNTTVTIAGGSDYSLSATPTAQYYSYASNPQGYPGWFNFAPAMTGITSESVAVARFRVEGALCHMILVDTGTSNSTSKTFTAPVAAGNKGGSEIFIGAGKDNGVFLTTPAGIFPADNSTTMNMTKNMDGGAWSSSGSWSCYFSICYDI